MCSLLAKDRLGNITQKPSDSYSKNKFEVSCQYSKIDHSILGDDSISLFLKLSLFISTLPSFADLGLLSQCFLILKYLLR